MFQKFCKLHIGGTCVVAMLGANT